MSLFDDPEWEENLDAYIPGNLCTPPKKAGFFDLPKDKTCRHPYHNPPSHIHIPAGKGYRHVCPGCGNVVDIIPQQVTL